MRKYINAINYNTKYIFFFELIFKLITVLVSIPFVKVLGKFIINHYDIKYISIYNLQFLFKHWSSILLVIGLALLVLLYFIFDTSMILLMVHKGLDKKELNFFKLIKESLLKTIKVFKPKNILYLLYPVIFILFMYIGLYLIAYYYTDYMNLLVNILFNNIFPLFISIIVLFLFVLLFIKGLYLLHEYILKDKPFMEALDGQNSLRNFRDIIVLTLRKVFSFIVILLSVNGLSYLFFYLRDKVTNIPLISILEGSIISLLLYILFYYFIKSKINDLLYLSYRYYYYTNEKISVFQDKPITNKWFKRIRHILVLVFTIICSIIMFNVNNGNIKYDFIFDYTIDITAHRGASAYAPENSMAAFKKAYEIGVPYIELDVHETKDGVLYVMHDGSLLRTTGLDQKDNKTLWSEIEPLYLQSRFDEYQEEKVPLFEDVLKWAKDKDVIINIELKTTTKSINLVPGLVDLIHKYKLTDKVVVASFDIAAVLQVQELDPKINIVYLGNSYLHYDSINIYSIYYAAITREIVKELHDKNKIIYAWTIDDPDIVKTMINMDVDNIITNNPIMVQDVVKNYKNRNKTNILFNFILYIF